MTRTRRSAKDAGARFERSIADYLQTEIDDRIDRRVKRGTKDRGDIGGLRAHNQRVVVEVKNVNYQDCTKCKRQSGLALPSWTDEAHTEAGNDDALLGIAVFKRSGATEPGRQWVAMTVDDLCALITGERHGHRKDYTP